MEYIKVSDHVVTELISTLSEPNPDWIAVNLDGGIAVGNDVRMFDSHWNFRPIEELIEEGLLQLRVAGNDERWPVGTVLEKVQDGQIVAKTDEELECEQPSVPSSDELLEFQRVVNEHHWVQSELENVQIELMYHWTDDERAISTLERWKQYARDLRNYTTTDANGNPQIREGETRPLRPTE